MTVARTPEFIKWFELQTEKAKAQIDARLKNIEMYEHFGDRKHLGKQLFELRWINGRRIYYSVLHKETLVILLLGGLKNAQEKDIEKARKILKRETSG